MSIWLKILLTDIVVIVFSAFMQYVYTEDKAPVPHNIFIYTISLAVFITPIICIFWIWA